MFKTEEKEGSYHLYFLRINGIEEETRDAIIQKIFDQDVSVNVHFQPLPLLTAYKERGYDMKDYPKAYDSYKNVITLPVYFDLTTDQLGQLNADAHRGIVAAFADGHAERLQGVAPQQAIINDGR